MNLITTFTANTEFKAEFAFLKDEKSDNTWLFTVPHNECTTYTYTRMINNINQND